MRKETYRLTILDQYRPQEYGIEQRSKSGKWLLLCGPNLKTYTEAVKEVRALNENDENTP